MNKAGDGIQNEQSVIDKAQRGSEFNRNTLFTAGCQGGIPSGGQILTKRPECRCCIAGNDERFDPMAVDSGTGNAVGRRGTGGERFGGCRNS